MVRHGRRSSTSRWCAASTITPRPRIRFSPPPRPNPFCNCAGYFPPVGHRGARRWPSCKGWRRKRRTRSRCGSLSSITFRRHSATPSRRRRAMPVRASIISSISSTISVHPSRPATVWHPSTSLLDGYCSARSERDVCLDMKEQSTRLEEYQAALQFDQHALDEALVEQPSLFFEVARKFAVLISQRDQAEQAVKVVRAQVGLEVRREAQYEEDKVTVAEVEARVAAHRDVLEAQKVHHELAADAGTWGALKEAYQQRSYAIKSMVDLHVTGYFGATGSSSGSARVRDMHSEHVKR